MSAASPSCFHLFNIICLYRPVSQHEGEKKQICPVTFLSEQRMSFVVTHSFVRLMKAQLYPRIQTSTGEFSACLISLHIPSGYTNLISFKLNVKLNQMKLNWNTEFMLLISKDIICCWKIWFCSISWRWDCIMYLKWCVIHNISGSLHSQFWKKK